MIFVLARLSLFCFYGAPEFGVFAAFLSVVSLILLSPLHYNLQLVWQIHSSPSMTIKALYEYEILLLDCPIELTIHF